MQIINLSYDFSIGLQMCLITRKKVIQYMNIGNHIGNQVSEKKTVESIGLLVMYNTRSSYRDSISLFNRKVSVVSTVEPDCSSSASASFTERQKIGPIRL
jgi:hypothetical protein